MTNNYNRTNMSWMDKYNLAKKYYEHYGNLNVPQDFQTKNGIDYDQDGEFLVVWLETQRQLYKGTGKGKLTQQKIELLDGIGMIWDVFEYNWNKMYELAKKYYEHYGDLNIPQDFKTINGINYDEYGIALGNWLEKQRQSYKGKGNGKINPKRIEKLDSIKMIWDLFEYKWNKMYELAKKYYEHYGDSNIPQDFKTTNGLDYDEYGSSLGLWLGKQRLSYKGIGTGKLTQKQIEKLDSIEIIWDLLEYNWNQMYELAKKYYEHYGDLNIPYDFKTKNGIDYDLDGFQLGVWMEGQRQAKKGIGTRKLTSKQIEKLDGIKMIWDLFEYKWNKMFELAKKYYEYYGDLNIPRNFKTINGIEYDEFGFLLGIWIETQRSANKGKGTGKLTQKQIEKLDRIEMIWDLLEYNWSRMYELAKKYYEHYGNLNIPQHFKTNNGIDYDLNGFLLGTWIQSQRQYYKGKNKGNLTPIKIKMLDNIKISWFLHGKVEKKLQEEKIDNSNNIRKRIEVLNRFYSLLNQYNESDLPDKETINQDFMNQLNHKSLRLK